MSASVTGLENLVKTFLEDSDDEKADEKDAGEPGGPSGEKEDQAVPSPRDTGMSEKDPAEVQASPIPEEAAVGGHSSPIHQEYDDVEHSYPQEAEGICQLEKDSHHHGKKF